MRGLGAAGWWEGAVHVESFPPVVCVAPGMRMQRAVGSTVHMHVCEWHGERPARGAAGSQPVLWSCCVLSEAWKPALRAPQLLPGSSQRTT